MNVPHRPIWLATSLTLLSACGGDAEGEPDTAATVAASTCVAGVPTIDAGGIGPVRLGAPLADLRGQCDVADTTIMIEGERQSARVVRLDGRDVVVFLGSDSTVQRVIVAGDVIRTERGIGVGSTVGDLRTQYGRVCPAMGEGRVVVSTAGLPGVSFALGVAPSELPGGGEGIEGTPEAVPDDARIVEAWVYDGPTLCGGS